MTRRRITATATAALLTGLVFSRRRYPTNTVVTKRAQIASRTIPISA
jgi:hypothetical protein